MPSPKPAIRDSARLAQLRAISEALPEIDVQPAGERHWAFRVRNKTFAYYLNDHHGDGIVAISCKSTGEQQQRLVKQSPDRYLVPAYLGVKGWVSLRLDLPRVNWDEVARLLFDAYKMQAPRRLVEQIE